MFFTVILSLVCLCVVYRVVCRQLLPRVNELVPSLPGRLPVIGHCHFVMVDFDALFQTVISFGEYALKVGDVTKFFLGPMPVYILSDPEDASIVLNKCLEKMVVYRFVEPLLGKQLVAAEVPTWKRNRRILDLCFKQHILDNYLELFNEQADRFVEMIAEEAGRGEVDLTDKITRSVLETTCRTALGARLDGKDLVDDNYIVAINECLEIIAMRVCKPWLMLDFIFNRSSYQKRLSKALETVFSLSNQMVQIRKQEHLERLKLKKDLDYKGSMQSVLDILLENTVTESSSLFSDVEMRNLADNVLLAAFDTTIYEMLFILVCIGSSAEVQEKIYQEIIQVLGEDGKVSKENLSQLVYLEAVIKESVRLYPIAPVMGRKTTTDTKLRNFTIPAGSNVAVHIWSVNRNTRYWGDDAEDFNPDRWLSPDTCPSHQAAYASFSPGRRGCIGKTYALTYLKATMVPLLRKFKLTADHTKMKLDGKIMLKPLSGHLIKIEERSWNK